MSSWGQGWGQFDVFPSSQIYINWRSVEPVIFLHKYKKNSQYEGSKLETVWEKGIKAAVIHFCVPDRGNAGAVGEQEYVENM